MSSSLVESLGNARNSN